MQPIGPRSSWHPRLGLPVEAGAPANKCGSANLVTPGGAASALGSPFNPTGPAGNVYAGNPGTASLAHSNIRHRVAVRHGLRSTEPLTLPTASLVLVDRARLGPDQCRRRP
jgi:hypothetical protein